MSGTVTNPFAGVAHYVTPATAPSLQAESIMQDSHGNLIVTTTDGQIRVFLLSAASAPVLAASTAGTTSSNPFSANVARYAAVYTAPTIVGTATIDGQGNAVLTHLDGRTQVFKAPVGAPVTGPTYPIPVAGTVSIVVGDGRNTLTYADGALGGAAVIQRDLYEAASTSGPFTHAGTVTLGAGGTYLDFLSNGTLRAYYLTTTTLGGTSPPSNIVSGTPVAAVVITPPAAGTLATPVAGNGTVAHTYTDPSSTGGAAITSHTIYAGATQAACLASTSGSPLTLGTGGAFNRTVANGAVEWIQVTATNSAGEGPRSNFAWGEPQAAQTGGAPPSWSPLTFTGATGTTPTGSSHMVAVSGATVPTLDGQGSVVINPKNASNTLFDTIGKVGDGRFVVHFPSGKRPLIQFVFRATDLLATNAYWISVEPTNAIGFAKQFNGSFVNEVTMFNYNNAAHNNSVPTGGGTVEFVINGSTVTILYDGTAYTDNTVNSASFTMPDTTLTAPGYIGLWLYDGDGAGNTGPIYVDSVSYTPISGVPVSLGGTQSGASTSPTQGTAPAAFPGGGSGGGGGSSGSGGGGGSSGSGVSTSAAASAMSTTYSGPILRGTGTVPPTYIPPSLIPVNHMPLGTDANYLSTSMPGFARSAIPAGKKLQYVPNGGTAIDVQMDQGGRRLNGSEWTVITTLPLPVTNGIEAVGGFQIVSGTRNNTPWITTAQIIAQLATTDFTFRTVGQDGRTYRNSLHDIMTNYPKDTWGVNPLGGWSVVQSGPYVVMVKGWEMLKDSTTGEHHRWRRQTIYATFRQIDGLWQIAGAADQPTWDKQPVAGATINSDGTSSSTVADYAQTPFVGYVEAYHGSTLVHAWGGPNDPRSTTIAASTLFLDSTHRVGLPAGFDATQIVTFAAASGGTLPTGITAGTPYWISYNGGWQLSPYVGATNYIQNGTVVITPWGTAVSGGTAGSGNIVLTVLTATYYGTRTPFAGTDTLPISVGFTPARVLIKHNEEYQARGARLFPRYDQNFTRFTSTQEGTPAAAYYPNQRRWGSWLSQTGDNPGDNRIGYMNQNSVQALLNPYDLGFVNLALVDALAWSDQPMWHNDMAAGRMIVCDNGPDDSGTTYPQMGANRIGVGFNSGDGTWIGAQTQNGFTSPNWSGYTDGYSSAPIEPSHMPAPWVIGAFLTGHPMFWEQGAAQAGAMFLNYPPSRQQAVGGTTYYNVFVNGNQPRGSGWALRAVNFAEAFTPASVPEAAYIRHSMDIVSAWMSAYVVSSAPEVALGSVIPLGSGLEQDGSAQEAQQYQNNIKFGSVGLVAAQGERQGFIDYLTVGGKYFIGILNENNPSGGSGYLANGGYNTPILSPSGQPLYSTLRALIAGTPNLGNSTPPFPATGFLNLPAQGITDGFNAVSAYQSVDYSVIARCALTHAYEAGIVSPNGDDAGATLALLNTRFTAGSHVAGSPIFSSSSYGGSYSGSHAYPVFAHVPA